MMLVIGQNHEMVFRSLDQMDKTILNLSAENVNDESVVNVIDDEFTSDESSEDFGSY